MNDRYMIGTSYVEDVIFLRTWFNWKQYCTKEERPYTLQRIKRGRDDA